jgi:hypothetical protein
MVAERTICKRAVGFCVWGGGGVLEGVSGGPLSQGGGGGGGPGERSRCIVDNENAPEPTTTNRKKPRTTGPTGSWLFLACVVWR